MELQSTVIGSVTIQTPIYNGAGTVKHTEDVKKMAESNTGAVTIGSISYKQRPGNSGDVFHKGSTGSINSLGVPNPGYSYYKKELPEMAKICADHGKPLSVSVQGDTPEEFGMVAQLAVKSGAYLCEINLACPNIWNDGTQKGIFGFYLESIQEVFEYVRRYAGVEKCYIIKVPDYSNPQQLQQTAKLFIHHHSDLIAAVAACNTHPNAFVVIREKGGSPKKAISFGKGFGGYAGKGYKAIALGQCVQWKEALQNSDIKLIGVGGIGTGEDAADYFQFAHVDAIQVVTALFRNYEVTPSVFDTILQQLDEVPELA